VNHPHTCSRCHPISASRIRNDRRHRASDPMKARQVVLEVCLASFADYAPLTAADLSAGRDPGLAKAVELLR
jgi:hypothetical protein